MRLALVCATSALVSVHVAEARASEPIGLSPAPALYPMPVDASNQAGWWKPLAEFAGSVFIAFNGWGGPGAANGGQSDTHTVVIAKRDPLGVWANGCLASTAGGCEVFADDVGHSQPTIALDGDGHIHAFVSMHNHGWRYWRSTVAGDVGSMVNMSGSMPDQGDRYTYPVATRSANGDVYLIIRALPEGRLYRWDNLRDSWARVAVFARDPSYVVYPDDIAADPSGALHLIWEWSYSQPDGLRHLGSYLRYSPATARFTNAAGSALSVPTSTVSPVQYQPLEGSEDSTARESATAPPGLQSAKVAIDAVNRRPMVAYRFRPFTGAPWHVRVAEWDGGGWRRASIYTGPASTYAALGLTVSTRARVYYAKHPDATGSQATVATREAEGSWADAPILPGVAVQRLAAISTGVNDHLYLVAPAEPQLFYGSRSALP